MPMPVITSKTQVAYESLLFRGLLEAEADGTIVRDHPDEEDKPFVLLVQRVTTTRFFDSRGERHSEKTREVEEIAQISVPQAAHLAQSLVGDLGYCYAVAERRVLTQGSNER